MQHVVADFPLANGLVRGLLDAEWLYMEFKSRIGS